jgi:hypothetical protein
MAFSFDGEYGIVCGRNDGATVWHRSPQGRLDLVSRVPSMSFDVVGGRIKTSQ